MDHDVIQSATALRYVILALQRQGNRQLTSALRGLNLTPSQAEVLEVLAEFGPMKTGDVGTYLLCESGSPSRILDTLAAKGLSIRSHPVDDRRATIHSVTASGRAALHRLNEVEHDFISSFAHDLEEVVSGPDQIREIIRTLTQLVRDPTLRGALARRFPGLEG
ncbi:winged helix DNA-binding protein [Corynebacterium bovis]|uniref:MarR family winged helix-turn-helix transcriptional regulator n=1 Tax=Corynebacterium bovis TaxID=36808 RepID=UPI00254C2988|nr:winged helix DNA-binding protein [Corynebacterium bovis]MDK8511404.1 winged helix DNA-binding protein [Corynebacterium bovis]